MAQIFKTSGECINIEPKNGTDFQLEELQSIVSGFIEIIPLSYGRVMVVNENGRIYPLGINHEATSIFRASWCGDEIICGDVLVCDGSQIK